MLKIDTHAHWFPPEWVERVGKEGGRNGAEVATDATGKITKFSAPGINRAGFGKQYVEIPIRLKIMNEGRVDMHALSLTSPMVYWATPDFGLRLSQVFNDACSKAHLQYPTRFVGMAMIPMQAPALAVQEIERAAKLPGIRGVHMATHVNGKNLDEKEFWPVYARCEALKLPIFLHPLYPSGDERIAKHFMRNLCGNPYETGLAAASLVLGGVLDAFPKLTVMLPQAGGAFPWLAGRFNRGYKVRTELKHLKRKPTDYLRRFYYDTITHHPEIMRFLVELVGADRIVLGSDYDQDMQYERPVEFVESVPGLSKREREMILGSNARRLLKISD